MAEGGENIKLDDFNPDRDNEGYDYDDDDEKSPFLGGDKMIPKTSTHRNRIFNPFDKDKDV